MANLDFVDTIGSNSLSYIQSKLLGVALQGVRNTISVINKYYAAIDFLEFHNYLDENDPRYAPYYTLAFQWRDEGVPGEEIANRLNAILEAEKKL
jgi:hypothetical protein